MGLSHGVCLTPGSYVRIVQCEGKHPTCLVSGVSGIKREASLLLTFLSISSMTVIHKTCEPRHLPQRTGTSEISACWSILEIFRTRSLISCEEVE